jgi:hypothetical protein
MLEPVCAGTGKYAAIHANLPGGQVFQNAGGSVMGALQDLYTSLQTGDNITAQGTEIDNALKQVDGQRVFYGNALNQIVPSESFVAQLSEVNKGSVRGSSTRTSRPAISASGISFVQIVKGGARHKRGRGPEGEPPSGNLN